MAKGGKTLNDRKLAADVRTLSLTMIKKVLEDDSEENDAYRKQVLLKLAPTLLPRLNENTGEDGKELPTPIINVIRSNNSVSEDKQAD